MSGTTATHHSSLITHSFDPPLRRPDLVHRRHRLRAGPEAGQEVAPAPGNDGVELNKLSVMGNLTIETGEGLDRVSVGSSAGTSTTSNINWPPAGENVPGGELFPTGPIYNMVMPPDVLYRPLNLSPGSVGITQACTVNEPSLNGAASSMRT